MTQLTTADLQTNLWRNASPTTGVPSTPMASDCIRAYLVAGHFVRPTIMARTPVHQPGLDRPVQSQDPYIRPAIILADTAFEGGSPSLSAKAPVAPRLASVL